MKIAESWLREWVNPDLDTEALGHQLTMLGHEVDGIDIDGSAIGDVVIAEVVEVEKHPDADRLSVCKVSDGNGELVDVRGLRGPERQEGYEEPAGEARSHIAERPEIA